MVWLFEDVGKIGILGTNGVEGFYLTRGK